MRAGQVLRPDAPCPAAALIVRDQTELRLCERSGQRTASVLWPWINRNARVADLVHILTHLQLLRARDIILACERTALGPGIPRSPAGGLPQGSSPCQGLNILSFLNVPGQPPVPLPPSSTTNPRTSGLSELPEAKAPGPRKSQSPASTLLSPGKRALVLGLMDLRKRPL